MARILTLLVVSSMALMLSGCTGAGQVGISNQTDHFSYGGQVAGKSGTDSYTWKNTQGAADISWGGQHAGGSFTLSIKDASGAQVYVKSISGTSQGGFNGPTQSGTAGDWTIVLDFKGFTGQMGLSITAKGGGYGGYGGGWPGGVA